MTFSYLNSLALTSSTATSSLPPINLIAYFKSMLLPTGIFLLLYVFIFYVLRFWVRRFRSDTAIVTIRVSQIPVLIIGITGFVKLFLLNLEAYPLIKVAERGLTAVIILTVTIWANTLFKQVLIYALKEIAQFSEEQWDDVLVPFAETTLPIIVYVVGIVLFLQAIGIDLTGILVALGGLTFVLGFAVKEILADFFAGLFLMVDSPFRFGDVVTLSDTDLPKKSQAIIKKIGLRLTTLYVIDQHCDLYVPNASFQGQSIFNHSRPTSHYYYTLKLPVKSDSDPSRVVQLIESVILAHPDTLGNVANKLEKLDDFYGLSGAISTSVQKRESGKLRLLAENDVNQQLFLVERAFDDLAVRISQIEEGGLDLKEIRYIQDSFLGICRQVGLELKSDYLLRKQKPELIELTTASNETVITAIRKWYQAWLKDPNLIQRDVVELPNQWEQKINLLKVKLNKAFKRISRIDIDETRLDNLMSDFRIWMEDNFKTTRNEWQDPKIWVSDFSYSERIYSVRFYVDDITLEYYQRGQRVQSEVSQELTWQLRRAYLAI